MVDRPLCLSCCACCPGQEQEPHLWLPQLEVRQLSLWDRADQMPVKTPACQRRFLPPSEGCRHPLPAQRSWCSLSCCSWRWREQMVLLAQIPARLPRRCGRSTWRAPAAGRTSEEGRRLLFATTVGSCPKRTGGTIYGLAVVLNQRLSELPGERQLLPVVRRSRALERCKLSLVIVPERSRGPGQSSVIGFYVHFPNKR